MDYEWGNKLENALQAQSESEGYGQNRGQPQRIGDEPSVEIQKNIIRPRVPAYERYDPQRIV